MAIKTRRHSARHQFSGTDSDVRAPLPAFSACPPGPAPCARGAISVRHSFCAHLDAVISAAQTYAVHPAGQSYPPRGLLDACLLLSAAFFERRMGAASDWGLLHMSAAQVPGAILYCFAFALWPVALPRAGGSARGARSARVARTFRCGVSLRRKPRPLLSPNYISRAVPAQTSCISTQ